MKRLISLFLIGAFAATLYWAPTLLDSRRLRD